MNESLQSELRFLSETSNPANRVSATIYFRPYYSDYMVMITRNHMHDEMYISDDKTIAFLWAEGKVR